MGKLVVIEGLDGSGKATQAALLMDRLRGEGVETQELSFPRYDDDSSVLVRMYLGGEFGERPEDVNCYAASVFYAADRYVSYKKHWERLYKGGALLVADRYVTSNAVFQMSKLKESEWDAYIGWLSDFEYGKLGIPKPDLVIYLDVDPIVSGRLLAGRYAADAGTPDIHERDTAFQQRSRRAALYCSKAEAWKVIDCVKGGEIRKKDDIAREVYEACGEVINKA